MELRNIMCAHDVDADLLRTAADPLEFLLGEINKDYLRAVLRQRLADPSLPCVSLQIVELT